MKTLLTMMLFATGTNLLAAQSSKALEVKEYKLNNGLTIWLNEDHSQPKVFGAVVVKAGAKDCPDTGIAHYFEHMMFKGTDKIGTINYEAEKVLLDSISAKYDELSATEEEEDRTRIQKEINELSIRSSEYVIPNEFNRLISKFRVECCNILRCNYLFQYFFTSIYGTMGGDKQRTFAESCFPSVPKRTGNGL